MQVIYFEIKDTDESTRVRISMSMSGKPDPGFEALEERLKDFLEEAFKKMIKTEKFTIHQ